MPSNKELLMTRVAWTARLKTGSGVLTTLVGARLGAGRRQWLDDRKGQCFDTGQAAPAEFRVVRWKQAKRLPSGVAAYERLRDMTENGASSAVKVLITIIP